MITLASALSLHPAQLTVVPPSGAGRGKRVARQGGDMPFLVLLVGAFVGAAVWYFRMRGPDAVGDVFDAAGHVKGAYNRNKFRRKVEGATLAGIDDPRLAAAIMLVSLAEAGSGLSEAQEKAIVAWLRDDVDYDNPAEAITFAKWAAREVLDPNEVARRLAPLWRDRLDITEKHELLALVARVVGMQGEPDPGQTVAIRRLRDLVIAQR
jgi:uncharacterized tellurite resistance protein B-like protein